MSESPSPGVVQAAFHADATGGVPATVARAPALPSRHAARLLKRGLDVLGAGLLLLILAPVLLLVLGAVCLDGGPALYRHRRVGLAGRRFGCMKFRTMVPAADELLAQHLATNPAAAKDWDTRRKLTNDPRVTPIGAVLRATSLDELPQLVNVLVGDMSLVGPRPVVAEELHRHYGVVGKAAYLAARPGITGLWQVSGRSDTSYRERVALDIRYATDWSLLLDVQILLRTIPAVLARRGAV